MYNLIVFCTTEEVVKGFNTAVGSMKRGEKAHFTIESDQLEGSSNNPPNIPEDQTIVFEVNHRIRRR